MPDREMPPVEKKVFHPYSINLILLVVIGLLSIGVGSIYIPPEAVGRLLLERILGIQAAANLPDTFTLILFQLRLPHTILLILTGSALATSGAAYQGLFRNPLADPYLIGVASGAGVGAVLAMSVEWPENFLRMFSIPASAFAGAILTVAAVYFLARSDGFISTSALILAGVAISSFTAALTSFLMLRSNEELRRAIGWLLGGGVMSGWEPVFAMLPYWLLGSLVLLFSGHVLNVLQFGDEQAKQLGLPIERVKLILILAASLTTAAAVAFAGVIGFIGLIVPHTVRLIWGPDYRRLIRICALAGSTSLLAADLIARTITAPQTMPVGIITALAGAPFFLWVLKRSRSARQ